MPESVQQSSPSLYHTRPGCVSLRGRRVEGASPKYCCTLPPSQYISVVISTALVVNEQLISAIMPFSYLKSATQLSLGMRGLTIVDISQDTVSGMPKIHCIRLIGCAESSAKMSRFITGFTCHVFSKFAHVCVARPWRRRNRHTLPSSPFCAISRMRAFCLSARICQPIVSRTPFSSTAFTMRSASAICSAMGL